MLHHIKPTTKTPIPIPHTLPPNLRPNTQKMSHLHPGLNLTRLLACSTPILASTPLLYHHLRYQTPIRCETATSTDPFTKITSDLGLRQNSAPTPTIQRSGAGPSPKAVKQISMGSILGVLGGLGVSVFSKPLAVVLGLGILFLQFLESRGIHLVPYNYIQRRFKQTDVKGLLRSNVAFKVSFGLTFALAAFAEF